MRKKNTNTVYYLIYMEFRKMVTIILYVRQEKEYVKAIYCHSAYLTYTQKTLESPLDCKEIKLVHPKGDQS